MKDVMKELEDLRQYKHNIEKEQRQGQINAILDNFKDLAPFNVKECCRVYLRV